MRRTERLFQIIQILRSAHFPVTGRGLADELEISLRTLYRDMAELMAQRVPIKGEAGTGYVLEDGYDMPPLMLTADELEAAVLGAAWVAKRGDPSLARGARDLVAKLSAVIPEALRPILLDSGLKPISFAPIARDTFDGAELRRAIRDRRKVSIVYEDANGTTSARMIWPIFIGFLEDVRIVVSWCESRQDFRQFRTDRIRSLSVEVEQYPERRASLLKQWKTMQARSHAVPV
jgi:predicted DNA-binding transcriptional regulator YafY